VTVAIASVLLGVVLIAAGVAAYRAPWRALIRTYEDERLPFWTRFAPAAWIPVGIGMVLLGISGPAPTPLGAVLALAGIAAVVSSLIFLRSPRLQPAWMRRGRDAGPVALTGWDAITFRTLTLTFAMFVVGLVLLLAIDLIGH
jgi:hypothetical protein